MSVARRSEGSAATPAVPQESREAAGERAAELLALDGPVLAAVMAAEGPRDAAALVGAAGTLAAKTRLLGAMARGRRAAVLEQLSAPLIAALIQNLEAENLSLLGELSFGKFQRLLDLCSAERRYQWIRLALSLEDARANALPLLLTTGELVEALLTRIEFRDHLQSVGEFPVEHLRLPPEALADPVQALVDLFGPALLQEIPVGEPGLQAVLQRLLDYDPDRYVDLVRTAMSRTDYAADHAEEEADLRSQPVLWGDLEPGPDAPPVPVEARVSGVGCRVSEWDRPDTRHPTPDTLPDSPAESILAAELPPGLPERASRLPVERQRQIAAELEALALREAVAAGGSFALEDLKPIFQRVEAYLLLGLASTDPGDASDPLARLPIHRLARAGAGVVEQLRQVALRLRPLRAVLDAGQQQLVESLCFPQLSVNAAGEPVLALWAEGPLGEATGPPLVAPGPATARISIEEARTRVGEVAAWVAVARALSLRRTAAALEAAGEVSLVVASLALGAVIFGRVELGLPELSDLRRFADRYLTRRGRPRAAAAVTLRRALSPWIEAHGLNPAETERLFAAGMDRLAELAAAHG